MAWLVLVLAGLLEVGWAVGLKYTEGFTRLWPTLWTVASMTLSVVMLGIALRSLPVGSAYAVWVGIGAVGSEFHQVAVLSLFQLHSSRS